MYKIEPLEKLKKEIDIPPDKSITHRALIFSSIAEGNSIIKPFFLSKDIEATLECLKKLGIKFNLLRDKSLEVDGGGLYFSINKKVNLYAYESGTTIRIMSGLLCGQRFLSFFNADKSLRKRPMSRITVPLRLMGADIKGRKINSEEYPPLIIRPVNRIRGITYTLPIASAQVKSAIILASLYAKEETVIFEPFISRDHTERMFKLFGGKLIRKNNTIICKPSKLHIPSKTIYIPADFSSASFFIVLGLVLKNSELLIRNVNINPTRCGLLKVLKRMGGKIKLVNKREEFEPYADILVKSSSLKAIQIKEEEVPSLIDEIPILCVASVFAKGKTIIKGVRELKFKETDRISSMVENLKKAGVKIEAKSYFKKNKKDWFLEIDGGNNLRETKFKSFSDHRTAMSLIILGLASGLNMQIDDIECINKSFPNFIKIVKSLT